MSIFQNLQTRFARRFAEQRVAQPKRALEMDRLRYQLYLSQPAAGRPNGVYFCGLKPYGAAHSTYPNPSPPEALPANYNHYRDDPGRSPFYATARRVLRWGLDQTLGEEAPLEAACCTNWCFARAADTKQLNHFGWTLADFAPYHRELLNHLQPRLILCAGNGPFSAYTGMLELHDTTTTESHPAEGRARIKLARAGARILVGFPHFSRYGISDAQLAACTAFVVNLPPNM